MKGIILAGGSGTRLYPLTRTISKQLLPIYDKPMIYYPLSTLMLAGIREILVITTPRDMPIFKELLGDGQKFGVKLEYKEQPKPEGLAQAFILAEDFIRNDDVCLILGDNVFYGNNLQSFLKQSADNINGARIFAYHVSDPKRYGVVEFNPDGEVISVEEKPVNPKSKYAITGLYFYDSSVVDYAKKVKPSSRGELEITDLNQMYLDEGRLSVRIMHRGYAWLDTGTHSSMMEASNFVGTVEKRQGLKVSCPEEIAYRNGWISADDLISQSKELKNDYGDYLRELVNV